MSTTVPSWRGHAEQLKRRQLVVTRRRATGLLVVMTAIFVVARLLEERQSAWGFVRATAEASMIGGLADWFAVTALFRRPLGLPIPHTAVIVERKDAFGRTLGEFVQENFLAPDVVAERIRGGQVAARAGTWLADPVHAAMVAGQGADLISGLAEVLGDDGVHRLIEEMVVARVEATPLAPLAARALEAVTAQHRHQELLDAAMRAADRFLAEHRDELRSRFERESPWWVPEAVDNRIFDKLFNGFRGFVREVAADPGHEMRRHFDERVRALTVDLRESPELLARGERLKADLLAHPQFRERAQRLWSGSDLTASLRAQAADPGSELRRRLADAIAAAGRRLADDVELQATVDRLFESAARHVLDRYRNEIGELVAATVQRWDAHETADRLELLLGPDLQFIRINGTVVGGLVGLAIHSLSRLL